MKAKSPKFYIATTLICSFVGLFVWGAVAMFKAGSAEDHRARVSAAVSKCSVTYNRNLTPEIADRCAKAEAELKQINIDRMFNILKAAEQ